MRICLFIEGQENVTWEQWVALGEAAEEQGFEALFRSDHYLSFGHEAEWGALDAWATINALASRTERIHLGTLVSPVTFRHPSELAKVVVTADHASEGRVELGMGAGWNEPEHRAYGFPFPPMATRFEMLEEQVEMVHRLWDRDEARFEGKHYRLEGVHALPKPFHQPHPNLIVGGDAGPRSAALAARWADEYNMNFVPPEVCREGREHLNAACEAIGRDPTSLPMSLASTTLVGTDQAELDARHDSWSTVAGAETLVPCSRTFGSGISPAHRTRCSSAWPSSPRPAWNGSCCNTCCTTIWRPSP
jgi:F420-dependent oxidoreductase-like protein